MLSLHYAIPSYCVRDADSHASIYDGCALGNAEIVRFRHNSVEDLDKRLGRLPADAQKLVVLEGVYSMLGDIAPLPAMVAAVKKHRSEEHTSELQSLMRISYAVFCLQKKKTIHQTNKRLSEHIS